MEADGTAVTSTASDQAYPLAQRALEAAREHNLITPADISNNRVSVRDQNVAAGVALLTCNEQSWVAKHAGGPADATGSWRAELAVYRVAAATGDHTAVPGLVAHSAAHRVMLAEALDDDWLRLDQSDIRSPWSVEIFARVATNTARWHQASKSLAGLEPTKPWLLQAMRTDATTLGVPPDLHELLALVLADESLRSALDEIAYSWTSSHVMHGDLRLAIVRFRTDGGVRLLNWKHSGWGDPRWDLAGLLQELHSAEIQHELDTSAHRSAVLSAYAERATSPSTLSEEDPTLRAFVAGRLMLRALRLHTSCEPTTELVEAHLQAARAMSSH